MTIICLGCSWTDRYKPDVKPWPEIIKERTSKDVINFGASGSGNRYAFDQFILYLKDNPPPEKVYWLMTQYERLDLISPLGYNKERSFTTVKTYRENDETEEDRIKRFSLAFFNKNIKEISDFDLKRLYNYSEKQNKISNILFPYYSLEDLIDDNLRLIFLVQQICTKIGSEFRLIQCLPPLTPWLYPDNSEYNNSIKNVYKLFLKSKYSKKIDLNNIMGFPFYKFSGGISAFEIKNWIPKYSISDDDNHPSEIGANLLADFFLGEKNILDYK